MKRNKWYGRYLPNHLTDLEVWQADEEQLFAGERVEVEDLLELSQLVHVQPYQHVVGAPVVHVSEAIWLT